MADAVDGVTMRDGWDGSIVLRTQVLTRISAEYGYHRQLKIWRADGGETEGIPWGVLQALKSECLGEDATAVEVYPAERNRVEEANMRHLWELNEPIKFGFKANGEEG